MHLVAREAALAGDGVGADFLQGVAEVRVAIRVVDGGGEEESGHDRGVAVRGA